MLYTKVTQQRNQSLLYHLCALCSEIETVCHLCALCSSIEKVHQWPCLHIFYFYVFLRPSVVPHRLISPKVSTGEGYLEEVSTGEGLFEPKMQLKNLGSISMYRWYILHICCIYSAYFEYFAYTVLIMNILNITHIFLIGNIEISICCFRHCQRFDRLR